METVDFSAGQTILNAGDAATCAYLIQEGEVEVRHGSHRAVQLEAGEVFGEMSLIEESPHSTVARAMTSVRCRCLSRLEFERLLTSDPTSVRVYLNTLFERLRILSSQLEAPNVISKINGNGICVTVNPLTRRAAATLPFDGLTITKYPYRIGRAAGENEEIPLDMNDLWLIDEIPYNVSRNHASIELEADSVYLKDRGSSLGIYVNDVHIGGKSSIRKMALEDGENAVIIGGRMSPYQFRINVSREG